MKKLVLLAALGLTVSAYSQPGHRSGNQPSWLEKWKPVDRIAPIHPEIKSIATTSQQPAYTLPNGNRVYALSQDNMPCVVPHIDLAGIPNAARTPKADMDEAVPIPNPGLNRNLLLNRLQEKPV